MLLYFQNFATNICVPASSPMEANVWQAIEIFNNLPGDDESYLGLIDENQESLQFLKYNKYVWSIEIPKPSLGGSYKGYFTKNKCLCIIKEVFDGLPLSQVSGLSFEKYL